MRQYRRLSITPTRRGANGENYVLRMDVLIYRDQEVYAKLTVVVVVVV